MTTIIAATDLKERSANGLRRAAQIARATSARLVVVHSLRPLRLPRGLPRAGLGAITSPDARRRKAEAAMMDIREMLEETGFDPEHLATRVEDGRADEIIAQIAAQEGASLIVMGLHRARRVLDLLRLTTMERVVLAANCPVLIAHIPVEGDYKRVLGAITFSPASAHALGCAYKIAPNAQFNSIHAAELPLREKIPALDIDFETGPKMTEASLLRERFMEMESVPDTLPLPEIVPGGMHEVLSFRVSEFAPDLLVIGTHSGTTGDRLGNYARDLMRAPPTDVLVAKPD